MVKILNCYLYAKKSYGALSKGAIFFGQPCIINQTVIIYDFMRKRTLQLLTDEIQMAY